MQPSRKTVSRVAGASLLVFAVFTLVACLSYLFTWKADQSLLSDPLMMDEGTAVGNWAGKVGFKWAWTLIGKGFGLAGFFIVRFFFQTGAAIFSSKDPVRILKPFITDISGALIFSTALSFIASVIGDNNAFGGGLGGGCGSSLNAACCNHIGGFVTFLAVAALSVLWFYLFCGRFSRWLDDSIPVTETGEEKPEQKKPASSLFKRRNRESREEEGEEEGEESREEEGENEEEDYSPAIEPVARTRKKAKTVTKVQEPADSQEDEAEQGESQIPAEVHQLEPIDIRSDFSRFRMPTLDLLDDHASGIHKVPKSETDENIVRIKEVLSSYKINVADVHAIVGPTVTLYKVFLAPGERGATVKQRESDIARSLGTQEVRVVNLADSVGIEVANATPSTVPFKSVVSDSSFRNSKYELPVAIGYTITQKVKVFDLTDAPHLLVAGATKQGKSVGLNVIIASLLYAKHPAELKFVFIDPKMVEFTAYKDLLHHYLAVMPDASNEEELQENAIIKNSKSADAILKSLCIEMDERYKLLSKAEVNNVKDYNKKYTSRFLHPDEGHKYMPYIVVVIDEYADLIMSGGIGADAKNISRGVTTSIIRLAQKGRAAGLHIIIATQRPSVDVVTPLIKTNFPTRIAFRVVTRFDSGTILDTQGAEKLIGKGDMLYYAGVETERVQCAYVSMEEIKAVTKFIGRQDGYKQHSSSPYYLPELPAESDSDSSGGGMVDMQKLDANFEEAARLVVTSQRGSTSDIQRRLGMGYARAGKVMDQLEAAGIVGPQEGSKPRMVLVNDLNELEGILNAFLGR